MHRFLMVFAVVAIFAGCSSGHKVVTSNGTTVTTNGTGNDETVTVASSGGTISVGKNAVNPASLGLPVYPGATTNEGGAMQGTTARGSGAMVFLKSTDDFDKVYAWYKQHMPPGSQAVNVTGQNAMAEFKVGGDSAKLQKSVTLTSGSDGTSIMLVSGTH